MLGTLGRDTTDKLSSVSTVLLLILLIFAAAIAIVETAARVSARSFLSAKLNEINAEISSYIPADIPRDAADARLDEAQSRAAFYKNLLDIITLLEVAGTTDSGQTVAALQANLSAYEATRRNAPRIESINSGIEVFQERIARLEAQIRQRRSEDVDIPMRDSDDPLLLEEVRPWVTADDLEAERDRAVLEFAALEEERSAILASTTSSGTVAGARILAVVRNLPSDILLVIAVVCCGAIGAVVSGLRDGGAARLKNVVLGLSAGFVAFLLIKGGKFLFIIQTVDAAVPLNPYTSAFAGILAGLFTERAYLVMRKMFDTAAERLTGEAAAANSEQPHQGKSDTKKRKRTASKEQAVASAPARSTEGALRPGGKQVAA